jgi:hypothetical protein
MHPFQVGEHCLPVEHVTVVDTSVLDDLVRDHVLVIAVDITTTSRAGLAEGHG